MVVAILVAGIWGIWKALVQRRYTETAGALGLSVVFVRARAVLRLPARAHRRPGLAVDEHALARLPLRRQPRHRSTIPSRPSARSPTTSSTRSSTSRGSCSSSAASRTASTPTAATPTASPRPVPHDDPTATSAATTSRPTRPATAATPSASSPARPVSKETRRRVADGACRNGDVPTLIKTGRARTRRRSRSTRPTPPPSTSNRRAAPSSG